MDKNPVVIFLDKVRSLEVEGGFLKVGWHAAVESFKVEESNFMFYFDTRDSGWHNILNHLDINGASAIAGN